jgi:hypothetical protein
MTQMSQLPTTTGDAASRGLLRSRGSPERGVTWCRGPHSGEMRLRGGFLRLCDSLESAMAWR